MIKGFLYGLRKFWFDLTSGDLVILFASMVLAVTAISGCLLYTSDAADE